MSATATRRHECQVCVLRQSRRRRLPVGDHQDWPRAGSVGDEICPAQVLDQRRQRRRQLHVLARMALGGSLPVWSDAHCSLRGRVFPKPNPLHSERQFLDNDCRYRRTVLVFCLHECLRVSFRPIIGLACALGLRPRARYRLRLNPKFIDTGSPKFIGSTVLFCSVFCSG